MNQFLSRSFSVDPSDTLLAPDYIPFPDGGVALVLALSDTDEVVLYDFNLDGRPPRRTPLALLTKEQKAKLPTAKVIATETAMSLAPWQRQPK